MSDIRELAHRLAKDAGLAVSQCGEVVYVPVDVLAAYPSLSAVETIVRAAMREGMMRAAEIDTDDMSVADYTATIRAEADKLEGKL